MDFRRTQRLKRIVFSRLTVVLLALVAIVLIRGVWGIYQKEHDTSEKLAQVMGKEAELEARKLFLESEIARLQTAQGVEEEIRENFGLGKEGEGVIIVVPHEDSATTSAGNKKGVWEWLKRLFNVTSS